ncbi:hypothetical protein [Sphingobacterium sp. IITKGP-BTPF85]|uniref:hypothetical protein n=1 Tax=Sphingobacterium sp. IITKGP-BTPF85 TaxID=1338009 RepID=UPI00038A330F|nr:hypothetical protein [Sphingobacterium sp. IITKGP-BTPF85]KKX49371.1 hypothetical protein L950_0216030 [Sphingobacterium sp. IITKGP-BTPF85]
MANCGASLLAYAEQCGENLIGGTKNVYMIAYGDLKNIEGTTQVYASADGVVSEISLELSKKFVKVEVINKQNNVTDTFSVSETGIISGTFAYTTQLAGYSKEANKLVSSLLGQPVAIILELANGSLVVGGLEGGVKLTESVGTISASEMGRTLNFNGEIYEPTPLLDKTILNTLI